MHKKHKISLIIPCYNERDGLNQMLSRAPGFIDEIIVVDNSSTDGTGDIAREYGAQVVYLKQRGYGAAYLQGLKYVSGDLVIMLDGDNTYPIEDVLAVIEHLINGGYDFITGCRFPLTDRRSMPIIKQISNISWSWLVRKIFKISLRDSQSGMLAFKSEILQQILPDSRGMEFGQDIKLNAWLDPGIKCGEIHVRYQPRSGKVKYRPMSDGFATIRALLGYRIRGESCF